MILEWAGKDVGDVMQNGDHSHSDAAFEMLPEYLVGRIGTDAGVVAEGELNHTPYCFTDCILIRLGCNRGLSSG